MSQPNIIGVVQHYINTMVSNIPGMKVFLLDKETTGILSMVYTQSQILQKEVFLFEKLDQQNRERMGHLKAVAFLRPTEENIHLLANELRSPKYGEYHLFFTNTLRNIFIDDLAKADENEVVKKVQEYFADYFAVNNDLFSLNVEGLTFPDRFERIKEGVISVLLSLKKKPSIRYQLKSPQSFNLAQEVNRAINSEVELFKFREAEVPPLLLILDRKDDPITPILMQWTYQAMVHELLRISNNRVDMSKAPGIHPDLKEVVLSPESDTFYSENLYSNYGDLCASVKTLMDAYQEKSNKNKNIQSLDDMKDFVDRFPEFRKMAGNVSKHVAVITEMSRMMDDRSLMNISELEQELACTHAPAEAFSKVTAAIDDPKLSSYDKLKLVLLYAIRYEEEGRARELMQRLSQQPPSSSSSVPSSYSGGIDSAQQGLVNIITEYGGAAQRNGDLLGNKNFFERARKNIRGLQGVQNIYAQHKPLLGTLLEQIAKNKLPEAIYPYQSGGPTPTRPTDVIVLMMGGVTYAEALIVAEFNKNPNINQGVRVVLGGTSIINSHMFLNELMKRRG
eukprot:TRINITY_DN3037_c0_g1_i1.p1 TRINITY_DN3037_c0_g1~~TRINITY_DN3037_c0_g1_i1.p1  ORF type:complete len:564 (-),score=165.66 TRINITY_DN3037_c0_g1_i1:98-1789(-)